MGHLYSTRSVPAVYYIHCSICTMMLHCTPIIGLAAGRCPAATSATHWWPRGHSHCLRYTGANCTPIEHRHPTWMPMYYSAGPSSVSLSSVACFALQSERNRLSRLTCIHDSFITFDNCRAPIACSLANFRHIGIEKWQVNIRMGVPASMTGASALVGSRSLGTDGGLPTFAGLIFVSGSFVSERLLQW